MSGAEPGQHPFVAEQPRISGRHGAGVDRRVRITEEHRVVAGLPSQKRHIGEACIERGPVQQGAIAVLVRARVETGSRGPAGRRVGPVICEQDTVARQRVERRCLDDRVAESRQAITAPLVERDEEDIPRRRHPDTLADGGRTHEPDRATGWRSGPPRPGSRRADRRSSELRSEPDQPRADARHWAAHCSATGHREAGSRTLRRSDISFRRSPTSGPARSGRGHQIPPMGVRL